MGSVLPQTCWAAVTRGYPEQRPGGSAKCFPRGFRRQRRRAIEGQRHSRHRFNLSQESQVSQNLLSGGGARVAKKRPARLYSALLPRFGI